MKTDQGLAFIVQQLAALPFDLHLGYGEKGPQLRNVGEQPKDRSLFQVPGEFPIGCCLLLMELSSLQIEKKQQLTGLQEDFC
ncbi:MAG: hypothetical protein ACD_75C02094G0001, partial [uncultured bacterium]